VKQHAAGSTRLRLWLAAGGLVAVALIAAAVVYTQVVSPRWDVNREASVAATRECVAAQTDVREDMPQTAALTRPAATAVALAWDDLKAAALFTDSSADARRAEQRFADSIRSEGFPSGADANDVIRDRIARHGPIVMMYMRRPSAAAKQAFGRCIWVVREKRFSGLLFFGTTKAAAKAF
jgi:hypothetical protein